MTTFGVIVHAPVEMFNKPYRYFCIRLGIRGDSEETLINKLNQYDFIQNIRSKQKNSENIVKLRLEQKYRCRTQIICFKN